MKAEPGWYVRITLPHGEQIHINEFTTEADVSNPLDSPSPTFADRRPVSVGT